MNPRSSLRYPRQCFNQHPSSRDWPILRPMGGHLAAPLPPGGDYRQSLSRPMPGCKGFDRIKEKCLSSSPCFGRLALSGVRGWSRSPAGQAGGRNRGKLGPVLRHLCVGGRRRLAGARFDRSSAGLPDEPQCGPSVIQLAMFVIDQPNLQRGLPDEILG